MQQLLFTIEIEWCQIHLREKLKWPFNVLYSLLVIKATWISKWQLNFHFLGRNTKHFKTIREETYSPLHRETISPEIQRHDGWYSKRQVIISHIIPDLINTILPSSPPPPKKKPKIFFSNILFFLKRKKNKKKKKKKIYFFYLLFFLFKNLFFFLLI